MFEEDVFHFPYGRPVASNLHQAQGARSRASGIYATEAFNNPVKSRRLFKENIRLSQYDISHALSNKNGSLI
jgi:hypothetical protein